MTVLTWLEQGVLDVNWWQMAAIGAVATHATIISVTVYLHRCQSHGALRLHPCVAHGFRFWLWLTTGMVTREWVAVHRCHHAHCETRQDPHSPRVLGIHTVLWRGAELYRQAIGNAALLQRYGAGTPCDWIERRLYSRYQWQGVALLLVIDITLFGVPGLTLWAVQMLWIPLLAAGVINGLGHYLGYRNYDCKEAATNITPLGLLIGGEELHNNHHSFPTSAKLSVRWFEFDAGWGYIRLLQWLGLASVRPRPHALTFQPHLASPTMATVRQVLANRTVLLHQLTQQLMALYSVERARLTDHMPRAALSHAARLLRRDASRLTGEEAAQLQQLLLHSVDLHRMHLARGELEMLWQATATPEQLLEMLRSWCHRAQHYGPWQLQCFAHRLAHYG